MKRILTLLLALAAVTGQAQQISSLPALTNGLAPQDLLLVNDWIGGTSYQPRKLAMSNFWGSAAVTVTTAQQLTNLVKSAARGTTIVVAPGRYHLLSTLLPLLTNNLNYHFEAGAVVVFGREEDSSGSYIFNDAGSNATTNTISGDGVFIVSNAFSTLLFTTNAVVNFECQSAWQPDTGQQIPLSELQGGLWTINVKNFMRDDSYDCFDVSYSSSAGRCKADFSCTKMYAADSCVEVVGIKYLSPGDVVVNVGSMEWTGTIAFGLNPIVLQNTCYVKVGYLPLAGDVNISLGRHATQGLPGTRPILDVSEIALTNMSTFAIDVQGPATLRNAQITGWTGVTPINLQTNGFVLQNCNIIASNTLSIQNSVAITNTMRSLGSWWNLPVGPRILVEGAWGTTNTHDTTLTADNQVVQTAGVQYMKLSSDNATATSRTFTLVTTTMSRGQVITLEWVGTNAGELVDDAAMTGGGNVRLSATWLPTQYDTLQLEFNGTDLIERARSTN